MRRRNMLPAWVVFVFLSGSWFVACLPLPIPVGEGALKGAILDQGNQIRAVYQDEEGVKYGVVHGYSLASELVTSEGDLGSSQVGPGYGGLSPKGVLAMDPLERPHVLHYGSAMADPELIHSWKDAGGWESESLAALDFCYRSWPSIAIDDSGDLHVSYAHLDCASGEYEVRYAKWHTGVWSEEVVFTDSESYPAYTSGYFPLMACRIALDRDQHPVIAVGTTAYPFDIHCADARIRIAERTEGDEWQVEEIFFLDDPCDPIVPLNYEIPSLSLALGPSGEKAVGFVSYSSTKSGLSYDYTIMIDEGAGWTEESICGGNCDFGGYDCPIDGKVQDIAYGPAGELHSIFTRERGGYGGGEVEQSVSRARRSGTGWVEETLWDNTLYPAEMEYQGTAPHLFLTPSSKAKVLYNAGQTLMCLAE
jgi:hypothetical protein